MAMATMNQASSAQKRTFSSVFPSSTLIHTTPTPVATPLVGFSEPGQSFGGPFDNRVDLSAPGYADVQRSNAWSIATRFMTLPSHSPLTCNWSACSKDVWHPDARLNPEADQGISFICRGDVTQGNDDARETLDEWYSHEVENHFGTYVQSDIRHIWDLQIPQSQSIEALLKTVRMLRTALRAYSAPLQFILPHYRHAQAKHGANAKDYAKKVEVKLRHDLRTLFDQALSIPRFYSTLSFVLYIAAFKYTAEPTTNPDQSASLKVFEERHQDLVEILDTFREVGLGGDKSQKALARAMDQFLTSHLESRDAAVDWFGKSPVTTPLKSWVENRFERFGRWALSRLEADGKFSDTSEPQDTQANETRYWQDIAIGRLGESRVRDLFEYVKRWDQSVGAIRDLKDYVTTPARRSHVTGIFIDQLHARLLVPAVSTLDVLNVYICVIKAFLELDPKGVLLDRVARPIRFQLKHREDAVRIIVESCLADLNDEGEPVNTTNEVCSSITKEINNTSSAEAPEDPELDWADLDWVPEPLDAEPGYRKAKSDDILSHLLNLFDREDFVKELQGLLADYLLRNEDAEYDKEIRLLELFKSRFGNDKLQACEVMLRDVQDSKRIFTTIKGMEEQSFTLSSSSANLQTKILSSHFWPELREDDFRIPQEILSLQEDYGKRFEQVKKNRKLQWLNAQGRVTVRLELEDRTVNERNVQTYQASVIYAFQEPKSSSENNSNTRTVESLVQALEMDEALVRSALTFWLGKLVLREVAQDTFAVVERLDKDVGDEDAAAAAAAAAAAEEDIGMGAVKSQQDRFGEKKDFYGQFVSMMLMNQGSKPVTQILMMMKMMLPEGFPFSEDDLREFLNELVGQGKLVKAGGDVFGIRK
ncbi:MAG: Anaphase-promoting complex subunit 2 [Bathelium mastoideum]|nr:MAG: Anaphase-promoting complex subunit 2 [Bathelium mastoideum]